jgi:hypothetical protein
MQISQFGEARESHHKTLYISSFLWGGWTSCCLFSDIQFGFGLFWFVHEFVKWIWIVCILCSLYICQESINSYGQQFQQNRQNGQLPITSNHWKTKQECNDTCQWNSRFLSIWIIYSSVHVFIHPCDCEWSFRGEVHLNIF